jgi:Helix-turn-helix domain
MTQKQAILNLLMEGQPVNWLSAFKQTGTSKLSTRVSEFTKQGFVFKKEKVKFKTKYKTIGYYYNYTLDLKKTPKKLLK